MAQPKKRKFVNHGSQEPFSNQSTLATNFTRNIYVTRPRLILIDTKSTGINLHVLYELLEKCIMIKNSSHVMATRAPRGKQSIKLLVRKNLPMLIP